MENKVDKILECYRKIQEEMGVAAAGGGGGGAPLPSSWGMSVGAGNIAGMPPEDKDPPVDLRKRKYKKLNMFYRQAVKPTKGAKNGRKGS